MKNKTKNELYKTKNELNEEKDDAKKSKLTSELVDVKKYLTHQKI